jgi:hypothetical protein
LQGVCGGPKRGTGSFLPTSGHSAKATATGLMSHEADPAPAPPLRAPPAGLSVATALGPVGTLRLCFHTLIFKHTLICLEEKKKTQLPKQLIRTLQPPQARECPHGPQRTPDTQSTN